MTPPPAHIVVTGAGGFIGSRLVTRLLADPRFRAARITAIDTTLPVLDRRVRAIVGDMTTPAILGEIVKGSADLVFHLAGVLGGAAEADYARARRVNVDASLDLLEGLRDAGRRPRVVFASSIAVFGPPLPDRIDDDTMPVATMTYGAQKRMIEVAVEQFSARGWIDGLALRLPGIVARRDADARLKSAFLNTLFHDFAAGRDIDLPVAADGTTWLLSVPACVTALLHAAAIPTDALGRRRAMTLPAQRVALADLVAALGRHFPASRSQVRYGADPELTAAFASQPRLTTALADGLGFRHDGDLATLIANALKSDEEAAS